MGFTSALARVSRLYGRIMSSSSGGRISPWLMLRPEVESGGGDMVYKFYSLEDKEVAWVGKIGLGRIVGSSHGWLALFNRSNRSLFLTDPVGGREIALPPVATLPDSEDWVSRVIISSSSPGEDSHCRALMIYGPDQRLAVCVPGHSDTWSPVSVRGWMNRRFENFAYSNTRRTFFYIARCECQVDAVSDYHAGKVVNCSSDCHIFHRIHHAWPGRSEEESIFKKEECMQFKYLVMDEHSDQLYVVVRHVLPRVGVRGSHRTSIFYSDSLGWDRSFAHKTVDFDVYKIDIERREIAHMDSGSLDGLALFVGLNHPFAVRPLPTSQLQPNSIYFTDLPDHISWYYSCHDNGVFDYETKSFSLCHPSYPIDLRSIKPNRRSVKEIISAPLPFWYTPTTLPD